MADKYAYDVSGARSAGFSDSEIADYLAEKTGYNITGAREAGFADVDIINHLTPAPKREEPVAAAEEPAKPASGFISGVGKALAQQALKAPGGAVEMAGSTAEVASLIDKVNTRRQVEVFDKVDAGEEIKPGLINMAGREQGGESEPAMDFGPVAGRGDQMRRQELIWANQYKRADPETRAAMRQHAADILAAGPDALQRAGADIRHTGESMLKWAEKTVPLTPEEEGRTSVQVTKLLTAMVPYVAASVATGGAGLVGYGTAEALNRTYTEAINSGADPERAAVGAVENGLMQGVMNVIPAAQAARLMERLPAAARGRFVEGLAEAAMGAGNMIGMSQLGQLAENAVAAKTFEPDRALDKGLGENLGVQAIAGAALPLGAMGVGAAVRRIRGERPLESPRTKTAEEVGKTVMDAPDLEGAVTLAKQDLDNTINQLRELGTENDRAQADTLDLFSRGELADGKIQQATDGQYFWVKDDNVVGLKVWDGTPGEGKISPDLANAQRDIYGKMGFDVVYIDDARTPFDGAVLPDKPNTIFLSTSTDRNAAMVGAHEVGHLLENVRLPDGTNLGSKFIEAVARNVNDKGLEHALVTFDSREGAPRREQFDEGRDGDLAFARSRMSFLIRELAADTHGEMLAFSTFMPRVIDQVQARYGADTAKGVLRQFLDGLRVSMERMREMFFGGREAFEYGSRETKSQHWFTNIEEIHDIGARIYAEKFGTQAEKENATLRQMRERVQRERMLEEFERPTSEVPPPSAPEGFTDGQPRITPEGTPNILGTGQSQNSQVAEPQRPSGPPLPPTYAEAVQKAATYRRWLGELDEQRRANASESPEARALQAQIDSILGKVRGNEDRLTNAARDRLEAARTALDEILNPVGDSPEMARVRAALEAEQQRMADAAGVGTPSPGMERALRPGPSRRAPRPRAPVEIRGEAIMPRREEPFLPAPEVAPAEPVISAPQNEPLRPVPAPEAVTALPAPDVRPAAPAEPVPADVRTPAPERAPFDPSLQRFDDLREKGTLTWEPPVEWQPTAEELSTARRLSRGWTPEVELRRPQSLSEFVRKNGGISMDTPEGGDMRAADLNRLPGLLRRQGVQADWMAQRARDAGYDFGRDTDYGSGVNVDAFLNALIEDGGGRKKHYPDNHDTEAWRQQQAHMAELHNYISDVIDLRPKDMDPRRIAWILRQEPEAAKTLALAERADRLSKGGSEELARRLDADRAQAERDMTPEPGAWEMADHRDLPSPDRAEVERYYGEFQAAAGADRNGEPVAPQGQPASEVEAANRFLASTRSEGARPPAEVPGAGSRGSDALVGDRLEPLYSPREVKNAREVISEVIGQALKSSEVQTAKPIAKVSGWLVQQAREAGIEIGGYRHAIDTSAVRHIFKQHGNEARETARGQLPVSVKDIRSIPDVLAAPDAVILGAVGRRGNDVIGYVKKMDDGSTLYLEEVRTGNQQLAAMTMRRYPATTNVQSITSSVVSHARSDGGAELKVVPGPGVDKGGEPQFSPRQNLREQYGFEQDNPAKRGNEEWLREKQARADANYSETRGIQGATTGWLRDVVQLPTDLVAGLPGARGERRGPGEGQYEALMESVRENGWRQKESPILVEVNHRGEAFITEGNTRARVAADLGEKSIAAEVKWLNGGEEVDGPWSPDRLLARIARDNVKFSPRLPGERPLLETREATPEELAARQRQVDKVLAEANMRGRKVAGRPQESAEDLPIFGGQRQADMFGGEEPAPKPKQGTLFSPRVRDEADAADITKRAKDLVGITSNPREAGYVTRDGQMLDMSGRHWDTNTYERQGDRFVPRAGQRDWVRDQRQVDHRDVAQDVTEASGTDAMREFMDRSGAMRVDFNVGVVSASVVPSQFQIESVARAARRAGLDRLSVERVDGEGRTVSHAEVENITPRNLARVFNEPMRGETLFSPRQTETPAFRQWFGESKIKDDDGQPLRLYHGTRDSVQSFDLDHPNRKDTGWLGTGVYLTNSPSLANSYSMLKRGSAGENVMPLYARMENPYRATMANKERFKILAQRDPEEARLAADAWTRDLRAKGYDGVILEYPQRDRAGGPPVTEYVVFDPTSVKSASGNRGTFDRSNPDIAYSPRNPGPNAPGVGVEEKNRLGFAPALRVKVDRPVPPPVSATGKPVTLIGQETTNGNAPGQLAAIDTVLAKFPNATRSTADWSRMQSYAFASDEVPVPPYAFIKGLNGADPAARIKALTPGQIEDANHGFEAAREFRRAYVAGELDAVTTGKLFMWSFLSRGVSPYTQESLFIDSFKGADQWIRKAAEGKFTEADLPAYAKWASTAAPKGSGQPGAGSTHNLNAFGNSFLLKMSQPDGSGVSRLQHLHNMMADPTMTGQQIRREFMRFGEGVGIDNKVVSFTLLVTGHTDVMVIDRVQTRQLWDDGRFADRNIYDGQKNDKGKVITGTPLADLTYGARGLLVYEAIERGLAGKINQIYAAVGRPQDASIGRYHWESWVAYSQQEASHGTLDAILHDAKGDDLAIARVTAKQGEYGAYEYGARYGRDVDGTPYFLYATPSGKEYAFSVPAFRGFLEDIKASGSAATRAVPANFKVTESGNAPWYNRPEVNRARIEELAAARSDRGAGPGEGAGALREAVQGEDLPGGARPNRGSTIPDDEAAGVRRLDVTREAMFSPRQTDTPEFKRWFGKSQVKDADGQPRRVFHATDADEFTMFDTMDFGSWFAESRSTADTYMNKGQGGRPRVYEVYLRAEKPLRIPERFDLSDDHEVREVLAAINKENGTKITPKQIGYDGDYVGTAAEFIGLNEKFVAQVQKAGFDSMHGFEQGEPTWAVLDPEQIKSATDNTGTFDPSNPDIRFSPRKDEREPAPTFYSAVERAVQNAKIEKAPPGQWLGTLKNLPGVKPEEVQWLGLEDWLKSQPKTVTKQEVLDYVRANRIEVKEVMLDAGKRVSDADIAAAREWLIDNNSTGLSDRISAHREIDTALNEASRGNDDGRAWLETWKLPEDLRRPFDEAVMGNTAQYSQYTLPGGENYRELLLTLPHRERPPSPEIEAARARVAELTAAHQNALTARLPDAEYYRIRSEVDAARVALNQLERANRAGTTRAEYQSSHWDEPNVLAHVRFDDRTGPNGERVLHVAEVQSDWHQQGRKQGYKLNAQEEAEKRELEANRLTATPPYNERYNELSRRAVSGIPDAPFKTTWPELAMKRVIRYAAENGYDRVSWDTGATNAERYDLSKQISKVTLHDNSSGGVGKADLDGPFSFGKLTAFDHDGKKVINDKWIDGPEELANTIGKEAADKLLNAKANEVSVAGLNARERSISGLDLKVGGEGMAAFYDKQLPLVANKLGKKFGAKVEAGEVPGTDAAAHSIPITDAMRKAVVEEGQPLFSPRTKGTDTYTPAEKAAAAAVRGAAEKSFLDRFEKLKDRPGTQALVQTVDPYAGITDRESYLALRNANSTTGAQKALITQGTIGVDKNGTPVITKFNGGLKKIFDDLGADVYRWADWIAANRAEQLSKEERERLYTPEAIKTLKGLIKGEMEADYTLSNGKTTRSREAAFLDALARYDEINKSVKDLGVNTGMVSRKVVDELWSNPFYLPFFRQAGEDGTTRFQGPTTSGGMTRQVLSKKLKGGTEKLNEDLLENIEGNMRHMVDASIRNNAANITLRKAEADGIAARISEADYNAMTKAEKSDVTWTMVDGEKQYWRVDDPLALTAIEAVHRAENSIPFISILRGAKKLLQTGVAVSPLFQIKNLARDATNSIAIAPLSYNVFKNVYSGMRQQDVQGALVDVARAVFANKKPRERRISEETAQAMAGGATMEFGSGTGNMFRGSYLDTPSKLGKFGEYFRNVTDAYEQLSTTTENNLRLALYEQQRAQGKSHAEAAFAGRDLNDYTLRGASPVVRFFLESVPFLNPWMQGLYKVGRTATDKDINTRLRLAGMLATMAGLVAINDAFYADDKDYKARNEDDRNANFWFKFAGQEYRIPMGFEVAALARMAANWGEALYAEDMSAGRAWKNTLKIMGNTMGLDPTPQLIKPMLDLKANKSRTGAPIETTGMERLRPEYRTGANTTQLAQWLSEGLNKAWRGVRGPTGEALSPVQIDYLIQGYSAWLGTTAMQVVDEGLRMASGEPEKPARDWLGSFTGGMVSETPSSQRGSTFYTNLLYEQGQAIQQAYATFNDLAKRGRTAEARDYLEANRDLIKKYPIYSQTIRLEGEINQQIRTVTESRTLTPEQKRVRIMQLNAMKTRAAENVFRAVNQ